MRIGILLGVMPRMLQEVVNGILRAEPDMRVVAEGVEDDVLAERVALEVPDVVLMVVPAGPPPALCGELLRRFPRLTIVALEDCGHSSSIYTLRPVRVRVEDLSGSRLVHAIRGGAFPMPFLASPYDIDAYPLERSGPSPDRLSDIALRERTSS